MGHDRDATDFLPASALKPFRVEGWRDGGKARFLAMAPAHRTILAWTLSLDMEDGSLECGTCRFPHRGGRRHGPERAAGDDPARL